ncbi:MAG: hypothetical protein ACM3PW_06550 [Chlamydiota bacterium]
MKFVTCIFVGLLLALPAVHPIHKSHSDIGLSCTHTCSGRQALDVDSWYCALPPALAIPSHFSFRREPLALRGEVPVLSRIEVVQVLDRPPPNC